MQIRIESPPEMTEAESLNLPHFLQYFSFTRREDSIGISSKSHLTGSFEKTVRYLPKRVKVDRKVESPKKTEETEEVTQTIPDIIKNDISLLRKIHLQ